VPTVRGSVVLMERWAFLVARGVRDGVGSLVDNLLALFGAGQYRTN
jgi:hypothetical protein